MEPSRLMVPCESGVASVLVQCRLPSVSRTCLTRRCSGIDSLRLKSKLLITIYAALETYRLPGMARQLAND